MNSRYTRTSWPNSTGMPSAADRPGRGGRGARPRSGRRILRIAGSEKREQGAARMPLVARIVLGGRRARGAAGQLGLLRRASDRPTCRPAPQRALLGRPGQRFDGAASCPRRSPSDSKPERCARLDRDRAGLHAPHAYDDAARAYRTIIALSGSTAQLQASLGEALVYAAGGGMVTQPCLRSLQGVHRARPARSPRTLLPGDGGGAEGDYFSAQPRASRPCSPTCRPTHTARAAVQASLEEAQRLAAAPRLPQRQVRDRRRWTRPPRCRPKTAPP